jgi:rod shape-determining protein MreC
LSEFSVQGDFLSARGFTAVGARVIGKNFESEAQMILLDRGSNDGIVAGAPVVVRDGAIVGRVIAVEKHQSRMLLLNDSQSSLAAIVQNETNSAGVVVGDRGLTVKMELISNDQIIAVGEVTITSGLEKTIPRGLVIGQIDRVEAEPNSFFQTAFIRPLADLNNLTAVSVVVGFQDE